MAPGLLADAGILATSGMHTHKSAPIAALPRRVPHPRNWRPSALEVILRRPQEPPPPKPLTPLVRTLWLLPAHAAAQPEKGLLRIIRESGIRIVGREHAVERSKRSLLHHACHCCVPNPHGSHCSWASTGARRWRKPPSWTANPSGERLSSFYGLPYPRSSRRPPRVSRPRRLPPASRRSTHSSPPSPCACLSAMHEHDRPGGYGGRRRHHSHPPRLLSLTREEADVAATGSHKVPDPQAVDQPR